MPTATDRLTFIALSVSDLRASTYFYRNVLGIPLQESSHDADLQDPWYGGDHAACSWTDGAFMHFALYPSREPERPVTSGAQVGFHVTDFDTCYQKALQQELPVLQEARDEPWGRTARFLDPDGNIVSITHAPR